MEEKITKHRFYKTNTGSWFIDLPEWKGPLADLQMVAGADTLLDEVSAGKKEVEVLIATTPIAGFNLLTRVEEKAFGGADYLLEKYGEKRVHHPLWLCDVTRFVFNSFPEKIYFKVLD